MTLGFLVGKSTDSMASDIFIWWAERFERCRPSPPPPFSSRRGNGENGDGQDEDEEMDGEMGVDFIDGEGVLWVYEDEGKSKKVEAKKEKEKDKEQGSEEPEEKRDAIEVEQVLSDTHPEDSAAPDPAGEEEGADEEMDVEGIEGEEDVAVDAVDTVGEEVAESVLIPMDDHPMLVHKTDPEEMAMKLFP